jgi:2-haloacid dehalogenase
VPALHERIAIILREREPCVAEHLVEPDPRVYRESVYALGLNPDEVCMVAAHREDLKAAAGTGLRTAFVERFGEDPGPPFDADVVAYDFNDLAQLACSP